MKWLAIMLLSASSAVWAQTVVPPRVAAIDLSRAKVDTPAKLSTDERVKLAEAKLQKSHDDPKLIADLVSAYLQKLRETGDFHYLDRSAQLVDRLLERDGGNFDALRFANEIDLQRHDFRAVAERSRDMVKYNASDPGLWGNLGDSLMELGEYDGAGEAYAKMFALRPNLASYNRAAWFRFVTGDAAAGIELMKQAIEAGGAVPENTAWCLAELGDMYFKTGKLDEAETAYRDGLALFPTLHRASAGVGRVEAARGNATLAIQSFRKAQAVVPMVEYAGSLEDLYTAEGNPDKAREQRELVDALVKIGAATNEKTNRNLALVLANHDRSPALALQLIQTEIQSRPDVYTWDALSWVLLRNGQVSEAREASGHALRLNTPEPLFYFHARAIAEAAGDAEAASKYDARLNALNPDFNAADNPRHLQSWSSKK